MGQTALDAATGRVVEALLERLFVVVQQIEVVVLYLAMGNSHPLEKLSAIGTGTSAETTVV